MDKCKSIHSGILDHLATNTVMHSIDGACVITLPIPTVDGRLVDVFIEHRMTNHCVVHDGGKTSSELSLQGVNITESIIVHFSLLARRFGLEYKNETFTVAGNISDVHKMALAVGVCSGMAMAQVVGHMSPLAEEPLRHKIGNAVKGWAKRRFKVSPDVQVPGEHAKHRFDFVAYPKKANSNTIAMSVLLPGSNSLGAAERFGFKTTDLKAPYNAWGKVVIQGKSESWSSEAKNIIRSCADAVVEIGGEDRIDTEELKEKLDSVSS